MTDKPEFQDSDPNPELTACYRDLTQLAEEGQLDPVIGREKEITRILEILVRRTRNYPFIMGDSDFDKSSVVEGIAQAIVHDEMPKTLKSKRLIVFDGKAVHDMIMRDSGTVDAFARCLRDACSDGNIVFFNDISLALAEQDFAFLRPMLSQQEISLIGGGTTDDFDSDIRADPLLSQLFQPVEVAEPSTGNTLEILKGWSDRYEAHHRVAISSSALVAAVELADRYITDQFLVEAAMDLVDDACAHVGVRRAQPPPQVRAFDERIARTRDEKEIAINDQDFERAAAKRDEEKQLVAQRRKLEKEWRAREDNSATSVRIVDEDAVVAVVARRTGVSVNELRAVLAAMSEHAADGDLFETDDDYVLLNDKPIADVGHDLLRTSAIAERIATIIRLSRQEAPLVIAIDGRWGVGKSTLLARIDAELPDRPEMVKVRFNAWTAEGDNALESLIKSVLVELDPRVVRRWVRRVMKHKRMLGFGWLLFGFVARLFGVARLVDELWTRLDVNAQTRNELRDNIHGMLSDWVNRSDRAGRSLVVFIDDLDRCDDDVVVGVCEAVKLYLDAPGLIFVIGCDLSVLARGVAGPARGGASEGRQYLEKIVQVAYRVPMPNADEIRQLIVGCGARAGINHLLNPTVVDILADGTARNPRRIKRIINSFVLEHHIDPAWRRPPLDSALLISAILLRDIYPSFYSVLVDSTAGDDPIGDFLDYAAVRARAADPRLAGDAWWATARRIFRKHGLQLPEKSDARDAGMRSQLEELERALPEEYPQLARNDPFVALLRAIGDSDRRSALRSRLINNPLGTESLSPATVEAESGESSSFVSS